jgi:hypothetical protein
VGDEVVAIMKGENQGVAIVMETPMHVVTENSITPP